MWQAGLPLALAAAVASAGTLEAVAMGGVALAMLLFILSRFTRWNVFAWIRFPPRGSDGSPQQVRHTAAKVKRLEGETARLRDELQRLRLSLDSSHSGVQGLVEQARQELAALQQQVSSIGETGSVQSELAGLRAKTEELEARVEQVGDIALGLGSELRKVREAPGPEAQKVGELSAAVASMGERLGAIQEQVEALRKERLHPPAGDVSALKAELEVVRDILVDHQECMEGLKVRLKNQELTMARADEIRELFRSLASQKEDLAQLHLRVEELAGQAGSGEELRTVPGPPRPRRAAAEAPAEAEPEPAAPERPPDEAERLERELRDTEAFLKSLEEYHKSGLMSDGLYLARKTKSEKRLRELRGALGRRGSAPG